MRVDPEREYSIGELRTELERFKAELQAAGLRPNSVWTYVNRSEYFVRWLAGEYKPSGPR